MVKENIVPPKQISLSEALKAEFTLKGYQLLAIIFGSIILGVMLK